MNLLDPLFLLGTFSIVGFCLVAFFSYRHFKRASNFKTLNQKRIQPPISLAKPEKPQEAKPIVENKSQERFFTDQALQIAFDSVNSRVQELQAFVSQIQRLAFIPEVPETDPQTMNFVDVAKEYQFESKVIENLWSSSMKLAKRHTLLAEFLKTGLPTQPKEPTPQPSQASQEIPLQVPHVPPNTIGNVK